MSWIEIIQIILIVLKCTNVITWPWVEVLFIWEISIAVIVFLALCWLVTAIVNRLIP